MHLYTCTQVTFMLTTRFYPGYVRYGGRLLPKFFARPRHSFVDMLSHRPQITLRFPIYKEIMDQNKWGMGVITPTFFPRFINALRRQARAKAFYWSDDAYHRAFYAAAKGYLAEARPYLEAMFGPHTDMVMLPFFVASIIAATPAEMHLVGTWPVIAPIDGGPEPPPELVAAREIARQAALRKTLGRGFQHAAWYLLVAVGKRTPVVWPYPYPMYSLNFPYVRKYAALGRRNLAGEISLEDVLRVVLADARKVARVRGLRLDLLGLE
jgi:hypothetical protein